MKILSAVFSVLWIIWCSPSFPNAFEPETGDLIFIELDTDLSDLISDETGSPYSHVGILMKYPDKIRVAHSLGFVHQSSLEAFESLGKSDHGLLPILRHRELVFDKRKRDKLLSFYKEFHGLPYNDSYLWGDNECEIKHVYCSEFVTKILNRVLDDKIEPAPMNFSRNWKAWNVYFKGRIPQGKLGNSPASLLRDKNFIFLGDLKETVKQRPLLGPCQKSLLRIF